VTADLDAQLRSVVATVLGAEPGQIDDATSPKTLAAWDSVTHIQLVLAVEAEFGVQFDADEIADLASYRALKSAVERLRGG